ncbi:MAG: HesA/MoeB/ThiF family protein [Peptococcaceae bacterium]|nr:HesA/MoeB/ThiF family protein [Peptococcaceae bacterium]MBQ2776981.1 HesA/MoeB/ThiF family protein [Peptococcaceae bacterium]
MKERYARNIPALSETECACLLSKKIAVIGCGGLGGHLVELMARIGVKELVVVDGDSFDISNLNRQLLSETEVIGVSKADTAADRIRRINPDIQVSVYQTMLTAENADSLISGCDAVLDGLDNISSRKILKQACSKAGIPYIFGAISGWVAQAAISMPDDNLIELIYPEHTQIRDKSALSFTPALCASMQVSLCVKLLTGRAVQTGAIFYFDLLNQEYEVIPIVSS